MTSGPGRFEYYLIKLDDLLQQASRSDNPAAFLFNNNARTVLFMLEGLAKLYAGMHNEKKFSKIKAKLKLLEDALGAVDYYDGFAKDFLKDDRMPAALCVFLEEKRDEHLGRLNKLLLKKKWINHEPGATKKIRKKLIKADWKKPEKEIELIKEFYEESIKDINSFYLNTGDHFTDVEIQMHELRRKLRWLSIYPQALQGCIQLADTNIEDPATTKYLTPEIVNSSFNVMPASGNNVSSLMLEKKYFLSLSWMIAELGKLKDSGLRIFATTEAVQGTEFVVDNIALHRAYELNNMSDEGITKIMKHAHGIYAAFFAENILDKLITGISKKDQ
jgi:hypothetical protein